jgi:hypothetical protein
LRNIQFMLLGTGTGTGTVTKTNFCKLNRKAAGVSRIVLTWRNV